MSPHICFCNHVEVIYHLIYIDVTAHRMENTVNFV